MKKVILSFMFVLCMVMTWGSATVLSEVSAAGMYGYTNGCGQETSDWGAVVQGLIDELPRAEDVTAENREEAEARLDAIDEAKLRLSDEALANVDFTRYMAVIAVLNAMDGMAGAEVPMPALTIYVEVNGTNVTLTLDDIESGDSTENLKRKIESRTCYSAERQSISYGERNLEEGRTLADYNIQKESVLTLTVDTSGGFDLMGHFFDQQVISYAYRATYATCQNEATYYFSCVCGACDTKTFTYGSLDFYNHDGDTEIYNVRDASCTEEGYTGDIYCNGCGEMIESGNIIEAKGHIGGTATCSEKAVCDICNESYGEPDGNNHTGDTKIFGVKAASCTEEGYTGDIYCSGCNVILKSGEAVKAKGHTGGSASCSEKAVCDICKNSYGKLDKNNHAGGTEILGVKAASCTEEGYTGDTYCSGCKVILKKGEAVKAKGHTGGSASCSEKAVCDICKESYGEPDENNHAGGTEILDAKAVSCTEDGYTGDTYCSGCRVMLKSGEAVKAKGHTGGTATCSKKAVCDTCEEFYGDLNMNNHAALRHIEAKEATGESEGNIEYWYCEECGKCFSDEAASVEITKADTEIAKLPDSSKNSSHISSKIVPAVISLSAGTVTAAAVTVHFIKKKRNRNKV